MKPFSDRSTSGRRPVRDKPAETKRDAVDAKPWEFSEFNTVKQIRTSLHNIEVRLDKKLGKMEEWLSTENEIFRESQSQPEITEAEGKIIKADVGALFQDLIRIERKMDKHSESEDIALKVLETHGKETQKQERILEEIRMERDALQERVHAYLEQISSLKSKIEEQRCNASAFERQVSAEFENRIRKLESEIEDLKTASMQKEKQLREANEQIKQMSTMLKSQENLSWEKKKEESMFISILKNDLQTIWNEKTKIEEEFKRLKKQCGYAEEDVVPPQEEARRSMLRMSKSLGNLTIEITPTDHSLTGKIEGEFRQKIQKELMIIEKKLVIQTEEMKRLHYRNSEMVETPEEGMSATEMESN